MPFSLSCSTLHSFTALPFTRRPSSSRRLDLTTGLRCTATGSQVSVCCSNARLLPTCSLCATPTILQRCRNGVASLLTACLLSGCLSFCPAPALANAVDTIKADNYVLDIAKVIPDEEQNKLEGDLKSLEETSGWRIRVLTRFGPQAGPTGKEVKDVWGLDDRTTIIIVDPTSPNILAFNTGRSVEQLLSRSFFIELQSRYGNKFFVRDEGEDASVQGTVEALSDCLQRPGGCAVVPGLPSDQYTLTLITSCVGGVVFGYSLRLPPSGPVRRKWVWSLLFFPLWGSLFVNFGIGPIVSRTADKLPIAGNVAGFVAAATLVQFSPLFNRSSVEGPLWKKDDP